MFVVYALLNFSSDYDEILVRCSAYVCEGSWSKNLLLFIYFYFMWFNVVWYSE